MAKWYAPQMASHQSDSKLSSSQLFARLKTCHHFLHDQHWRHECWGREITGLNHVVLHSGTNELMGLYEYFIHIRLCDWCFSD